MEQPKSTLTFITESLPGFFVGVPANFTIEAVGGTAPYTFQVTQGSLAPLTLSTDGTISGTPTAETNTDVLVRLMDSATPPATVNQMFNVQMMAS